MRVIHYFPVEKYLITFFTDYHGNDCLNADMI